MKLFYPIWKVARYGNIEGNDDICFATPKILCKSLCTIGFCSSVPGGGNPVYSSPL
jgi:hypothetical protein